ncbi:hypothetical protein D3C72_2219550 [compost metagenome]
MAADGHIQAVARVDKADVDLRIVQQVARVGGIVRDKKPDLPFAVDLLLRQRPAGERAHVVAGGQHAEFDILDLGRDVGQLFAGILLHVLAPV